MLKAPFPYFGGKSKQLPWIKSHFVPAGRFVDVFGGAGWITLNVDYQEQIWNDLDNGLYEFFTLVKRNRPFFNQIVHKFQTLQDTLFQINPDEKEFKFWTNAPIKDPIDIAIQTFVKYRLSMSGMGKTFSKCNRIRRGMGELESKWYSSIKNLPAISDKLQGVKLSCEDFRTLIPKYDSAGTLFYLDPPYVKSTRQAKNVYKHEFTENDHRELAAWLRIIKGKFCLSDYDCQLYRDLYPPHFRRETKRMKVHAGISKIKTSRVECLWLNF